MAEDVRRLIESDLEQKVERMLETQRKAKELAKK